MLFRSGPKYYAAFRRSCLEMIQKYGVNYFKFDGLATGTYASGAGPDYLADTEAMGRLISELRQAELDLYINLTTGSWPSPFWLRSVDSLWRQGDDTSYRGQGTHQQQWLTYRDSETWKNIVRRAPLFPLNSLMSHGITYSRHGNPSDPTYTSAGLKDEIRAYFGSGTSLQELYIQPERLTVADWTVLAEAAKWSRANADVLVDTHWIGGSPGKDEVYGWASWTPRKGILVLRNPDDKPADFIAEVKNIFELPTGAVNTFHLRSPWKKDRSQPEIKIGISEPYTFHLKPFEVLVLETK